jgi:DNA repair protein RadD
VSLYLRPYQSELYERAKAALRKGKRTVLIQAPTGAGKTVLIAHMLSNATKKGYRAWFVNHRRELIKQSVLTLTESAGLPLGIVAAGFPGNRHERIQVCSVQTLSRRRHLLPKPDLIIWDECHHCAAGSWDAIHADYPGAVHIGLTATPERLDGTGLSQWFEEIVTGPSVAQLIDQGYLSPYRLFAPGSVDLSAVHTVAGDYNKNELANAMAKSAVVGDALTHYQKYAMGRRAVVFMWSIESSIKIAQRFNEAGIPAAHLDGETDDITRDATIENFRSGKIKILSNVEIVSEGFDLPAIEAAFLLRPTRSLALFLQQCGRALRPFPGKNEALIFDHAGNCKLHGLPDDERQWSLDGRIKRKSKSEAAPVKQCPKCYAMLSAGAGTCKWCGFAFEVQAREMNEISGELKELDLEEQRRIRKHEQAGAQSLEDLIRIGQARGYRNPERWANYVWKARQVKQAAREAERFAQQVPAGWA